MKKLIVLLIAVAGFIIPLSAQVDHDQNDNETYPRESLILKKDQIPANIVNAVNADFANGEAFRWGKFPFVLEKYGFVIAKGKENQKPDYYEVNIKTKDGSDIYAVYSSDGTIIQSKTIRKNAALPLSVTQALAKSIYKDWTIVGDKELIKYYNSKSDVEEHYRVTLEKNNVKKTVSLNFKEPV